MMLNFLGGARLFLSRSMTAVIVPHTFKVGFTLALWVGRITFCSEETYCSAAPEISGEKPRIFWREDIFAVKAISLKKLRRQPGAFSSQAVF